MYNCDCNNNIGAGNITSTDDQYLRIEWCDNVTDVPTKGTFLSKIKEITDKESDTSTKLDTEINRAKTAEQNITDNLNTEIAERRHDDEQLQSQINAIITKQETQQDKVITRTLSENTVTETFDAPNAEQILILQDENKTGSIKFDKTNDEVTLTSKGKLKLHNVDTPVNNLDAANKEYVDTETANRIKADEALQSQITDNATAISENERNLTQEITDRKAADSALEQKISDITAIQIRNKSEVIESTEADVQTTATNYIQTNYSRAPKNFDGLIITITDKQNDKILYVYSEVSNLWINSGINDIDLSNYYTKDQVYNKTEIDTEITALNKQTMSFDIYSNKDTFETVTVLIPLKETV